MCISLLLLHYWPKLHHTPLNSEAGARWPIFGLLVVATTSRRDNKVQMIRP
jgi:hypothetical protein